MRMKVTLHQLEVFLSVAELRSFTEAGRTLNVSQPALSRTIRQIEDGVGARLFDRDTRNVELTPAGRELAPIARRILGEFEGAFSELAQFVEGRSGRVTVAASCPRPSSASGTAIPRSTSPSAMRCRT